MNSTTITVNKDDLLKLKSSIVDMRTDLDLQASGDDDGWVLDAIAYVQGLIDQANKVT